MKQFLAILKDLRDSSQGASIVGHFSVQPSQQKDVTIIDHVHGQPKTTCLATGEVKNSNRYITEQDQNNEGRNSITSVGAILPPELMEVIGTWADLPDSIKTGIMAMVKTISG